ncbi:MAG TPA: Gfo/Idh/MocA family oxidoreductase [Nitrospirales bacterium]|nr:Gfo/Idh/MocA family oxidoreductase [Nitrospirales bacterium]
MRLAIIGLRNHAARMAGLVAIHPKISSLLFYHPDNTRISVEPFPALPKPVERSSDFAAVLACDGVVIASPHNTHFDYILRLVESPLFVLCEKPPASTEAQLNQLASLPSEQKARIAFNFNYAHTDFAIVVREKLSEGSLGCPLMMNVTASHGLAFKAAFANNWRMTDSDPFSTILGNLGIHYVHMILDLIGPVADWRLTRWAASPQTRGVDSIALMVDTVQRVAAHIFLSYAAPYVNSCRLILTDGIISLDNGQVTIAGPRDSFDDRGRFVTPPETIHSDAGSSLDYYNTSIVRSLNRFIDGVVTQSGFDIACFSRALDAARLIIQFDRCSDTCV